MYLSVSVLACGAALPAVRVVPRSSISLFLTLSYPFRLTPSISPCTFFYRTFEIALFYPTDCINSSSLARQIMDPGLGVDEVSYPSIPPWIGE
jgi:hypothetical protein